MVRVDNSATVKSGKANGKPGKAKRPSGRAAGEAPELAPAAAQEPAEAEAVRISEKVQELLGYPMGKGVGRVEPWEVTDESCKLARAMVEAGPHQHPLLGVRAIELPEDADRDEGLFVVGDSSIVAYAPTDGVSGATGPRVMNANLTWLHYYDVMKMLAKCTADAGQQHAVAAPIPGTLVEFVNHMQSAVLGFNRLDWNDITDHGCFETRDVCDILTDLNNLYEELAEVAIKSAVYGGNPKSIALIERTAGEGVQP